MGRLHRYLAAGTEETSPLFGSRGLFRVQV